MRNKYFYQMLSVLFAASVIFGIVYSCVRLQSEQARATGLERQNLDEISQNLSAALAETEQMTVRLAMLPSVISLSNMSISPTISQYMELRDEINQNVQLVSYIDSLEIMFFNPGRAYISSYGLTDIREYYDESFVKQIVDSEQHTKWIMDDQKKYFIRKIPIFSNYSSGAMILNLSDDFFQNAITQLWDNTEHNLLVMHDDQWIYASNTALFARLPSEWTEHPSEGKVFLDNEAFVSICREDEKYGLTYYALVPQMNLTELISFRQSVLYLLAAFFVCFLLTAVTVRWFWGPVLSIVKKINSLPYVGSCSFPDNEFKMIDSALDQLLYENKRLQSVLDTNRDSLKEHFMLKCFSGNIGMDPGVEEEISTLGLRFVYKNYYVLLVHIPYIHEIHNYQMRIQLLLHVKELITAEFSSYGTIQGTLLEDTKAAFVVNTDCDLENEASVSELCTQIQQQVKREFHFSLLFTFGSREASLQYIFRSYNYASQLLVYNSEDNSQACLFYHQELLEAAYNPNLHKHIVSLLTQHSFAEIPQVCAANLREMQAEESQPDRTRQLMVSYITHIYLELYEQGIAVNPDILHQTLKTLFETTQPAMLLSILEAYIDHLIFAISGMEHDDTKKEDRISVVRQYISEHYHEDISVTQIAEAVHLNSIYLNRLVKASTGKTLSELLNYHRISEAKKLLNDTDKTVAEIAHAVGYHDVRSFTRYFKKYENRTPSDFRM